jgi:hypothetical protein
MRHHRAASTGLYPCAGVYLLTAAAGTILTGDRVEATIPTITAAVCR